MTRKNSAIANRNRVGLPANIAASALMYSSNPVTITTSHFSSSSRIRFGLMLTMCALVCSLSVTMPAWPPVRRRALSPARAKSATSTAPAIISPQCIKRSRSRGGRSTPSSSRTRSRSVSVA